MHEDFAKLGGRAGPSVHGGIVHSEIVHMDLDGLDLSLSRVKKQVWHGMEFMDQRRDMNRVGTLTAWKHQLHV